MRVKIGPENHGQLVTKLIKEKEDEKSVKMLTSWMLVSKDGRSRCLRTSE